MALDPSKEIISPNFKICQNSIGNLEISIQYIGLAPKEFTRELTSKEMSNISDFSKYFIKKANVLIQWTKNENFGTVGKVITNDGIHDIEDLIFDCAFNVSDIPLYASSSNYQTCKEAIKKWKEQQRRIYMEALYAYNYEFEEDPCNDENYYAFKIRRPATLDEIKIIMVANKDAKISTFRKEADISFKDVLKEILIYRAIDSAPSTVATMEDLANCSWLFGFFREKTIEIFKDIDLDKVYTTERLKKMSEWINKLTDAAIERGKQAEEEEWITSKTADTFPVGFSCPFKAVFAVEGVVITFETNISPKYIKDEISLDNIVRVIAWKQEVHWDIRYMKPNRLPMTAYEATETINCWDLESFIEYIKYDLMPRAHIKFDMPTSYGRVANKIVDAFKDFARKHTAKIVPKEPTAQELLVKEIKDSVKKLKDIFNEYPNSENKKELSVSFNEICGKLLGAFNGNS